MKKLSTLFLSALLILGALSGCNTEDDESAQDYDNRNDFLTGDDVNYHSGNSRTNSDGKLTGSTASSKPSGHHDPKISTNHQQNQQRRNMGYQNNRQQGQNPTTNQSAGGNTSQGQAATPKANAGQGNSTAPGGTGQKAAPAPAPSGDMITQVVQLTNQERQKNGLGALLGDYSELQKAAQMKSDDMAQNKYFSHTSPTYGSPFQMLKDLGIEYQVAAENIAAGQRSAQEVVTAWMNSPGHRQNILNKEITHIGVGYATSGSYWTQLFIKK
ncbi:CAP domain-containing protein [Bacillus sp. DJP31]|uniref:CAP domain-containing protein n=1 Tax=Bacillus sp. DJP31 TaxID=3409789 RepID=UPI003BB61899